MVVQNSDPRVGSPNPDPRGGSPNPDPRVGSPNPETRSQYRISELRIQSPTKYTRAVMDSDREGSFVVPESSKGKSRQQSEERPTEEEHYTVILDDDEEGGSDPSARITLLNQRTRKPLSVITTEEEFLSSVQKFTSPWLDAIFGLTNSFFNL